MSRLFLIALLMGANLLGFSQWNLAVSSRVEKDGKGLGGATISLTQAGKVIKTSQSGSDGYFSLDVPANGDFLIEVSYPQCNSKKFQVLTRGVPPEVVDEGFMPSYKIGGFTMKPPLPGIDYSALKNPVVKILFINRIGKFDHEESHTEMMLGQLERIRDAEKALIEKQESFAKSGDAALKKEDCAAAKTNYENAIKTIPISPYHDYSKSQLEKCNSCLAEKEAEKKKEIDEVAAKKAAAVKAEQEAAQKAEADKLAKERLDEEKKAADLKKAEEKKLAEQKAEQEKLAKEKAEKEQTAALEAKRAEEKRLAQKKEEDEKIAKEKAENDLKATAEAKKAEEKKRLEQKLEEDKLAKEKLEQEKRTVAENKKAEEERLAKEKAEKDKLAADENKKKAESKITDNKTQEADREKKNQNETAKTDAAVREQKANQEKLVAEQRAESDRKAKEKAEKDKRELELKLAAQKKAEAEKVAKANSDNQRKEIEGKKKTEEPKKVEVEKPKEYVKETPREVSPASKRSVEIRASTPAVNKRDIGSSKPKHSIPRVLGVDNYRAALVKADELFKDTRYAEALEAYKTALEAKPDDVYAKKRIEEINKMNLPSK